MTDTNTNTTSTNTTSTDAAGSSSTRYEPGMSLLEKAYGAEAAAGTVAYLDTLSPDYSRYLVEAGFADVYGRQAIDQSGRELINVIALASLGGLDGQLERHIGAALTLGVPANEIVETLFHLTLIIGHPRANAALAVAKSVFDERGLDPVRH